jgi:alcohol dehydrogenase
MKAARAYQDKKVLVVEDVPEPGLRPGSAIVRLDATLAASFIGHIIEGGRYLTPPRPFTPGMDAIGVVEAVAADVRGLKTGERVYCDSFYEPHYPAATGARIFIGNFALGAHSEELLKKWPDGGFAEKMCLPAACIHPIRPENNYSESILCRLGWLGTAFGALRKANMRAGAVIAVLGASGLLGSSGVIAALGVGAAASGPLDGGRRRSNAWPRSTIV